MGAKNVKRDCSWVATTALSCFDIVLPFIDKNLPNEDKEMDYLLRKSAALLKIKKQLTEKIAVPIYEIAEEEINRVSVNKVNTFCTELKQLKEEKNRYSKRYHEKKAENETLDKNLKELQNKVDKLEGENKMLKKQAEDSEKTVNSLTAQTQKLTHQIKILLDGYDALTAPFRAK